MLSITNRSHILTAIVSGLLLAGCAHRDNLHADALTWADLQSLHPDGFIYRAETAKPVAALTFDDGPSGLSDRLLDLLSERGVKATFFWQGKNLVRFPDVLRRAIAEGHTIGQHSWDHAHVSGMDPELLWSTQVEPTSREFARVAKHTIVYYRPPFGEIDSKQTKYLMQRGIMTVGWSITSLDWDEHRNRPDQIFNRVLSELHPGAIILLHDYPRGEDEQEFIGAVARIIDAGEQRGYTWVNLDTIIQGASVDKLSN